MTRVESESLEAAESALKEAGFVVSQFCSSRPSCFDFVARKSAVTLLVKFHADIDGFSRSDSRELKVISECVSAVSLLMSNRSRGKNLDDDTVYTRYNGLIVTPKTFEGIITSNAYPLIHADPGGYSVEIDGERIKRRRQKLGLSIGQVAEMIGISRRTLYGYERGMARASVAVAYNLVYTLGIPVAKPIDVFAKPRKQHGCFLTRARPAMAVNKLLQRILKKFTPGNFTAIKRAPFDFVIMVPEEKMRIIGGVTNDKERGLERRVDEILSFSRIVQAHPVLITDGRKPSNKDIECIRENELSRIRTPGDLITEH